MSGLTKAERANLLALAQWLKPRYAEDDEWYIIADGMIRLLAHIEALEAVVEAAQRTSAAAEPPVRVEAPGFWRELFNLRAALQRLEEGQG